MNMEALFLFVILLLGLILCSFLGGNCSKEGLTNNNLVYNGPNGDTAVIVVNSDGTKTIELHQTSGSSTVIFKQSNTSPDQFSNPFGFTATISNGGIIFTAPNGQTTTFTPASSNSSSSSTSSSSTSNSAYDNYNHYSGSSTQLQNGAIFYGPNGGTVVVATSSDGNQTLIIKLTSSDSPITYLPNISTGSITTYYGPNGNTATIVSANGSTKAVQVSTSSGNYTFTQNGAFYNPDSTTSTQYYGSTGYAIQPSGSSLSYEGPYGGSAGAFTGPQGNTAYYAQGPMGNTVAGIFSNNAYQGPYGDEYSSALPPGIPRNQIPKGQEDLYILKSEIVPPICPACPQSTACPRQEKCPPCPACARCPEPAFECKKVPNYNAIDDQYLPQPVLNDFSQFGM